jgi:hypothetical protein
MTTVIFTLHDNTVLLNEMANYNPVDLLTKLLDKSIVAISAGNTVVNKNMIKLISPEYPEGTVFESPVSITLNDGKTIVTNDASYSADMLAEKLNDTTAGMFVLGDLIVTKNSVRMISKGE